MSQTQHPELMRQHNRAMVLATIQRQGPISRVELAQMLDLNAATISRITRLLLDEGVILEEGEDESKNVGRKRVLLRFNNRAQLVAAIRVDETQITGIMADLSGAILARRTQLITPFLMPALSASELPTLLLTLIEELFEANPSYRSQFSALTLTGDSDLLQQQTLQDTLQTRLEIPVAAIHPAAAVALAETESELLRGETAFLTLYLGVQSCCCLYLEGKTRIGGLGVDADGSPLHSRLCDGGLIAHVQAGFADCPESVLTTRPLSARLIFEAARQRDALALRAVTHLANDLANALLWMRSLFAVQHVVLSGAWIYAADVLIPLLHTALGAHSGGLLLHPAHKRDDAALLGAGKLAISLAETTV